MTQPVTLPQYWLEKVRQYRGRNKVSARQKDLGIWQRYTWDDEYEQVRDFGLGLIEMGLQRGDRVAILGDNDRQHLWAVFGAMAVGGVVAGVFTDSTPPEVEYIVGHSDALFVLAGDQEQCDKLLSIRERVPLVRRVIYWDERGMWSYNDPWLVDYRAVQALGRQAIEREPGRFDQLVAEGKPDDPVMFCYTSGTTGQPKGVKLSHANFIGGALSLGTMDRWSDTDNQLSFLPLAWIAGAALDIAPHVVYGTILNFAESPQTVQANIREIAPDTLVYTPRLWETLVSTIRARMLDSAWINRLMYRAFMPVGYRVADYHFQKKPVPPLWRLLYWLGARAVFQPLLSQFGLHKVRVTYTSGAALSPDAIRFFRAMGLPLRQIYGSTEICGGSIAHRPDDIKFESLGRPMPGYDARITPDGEILLTGPGLFLGYHKSLEATESAIYTDETGRRWFRTGDAGHMDADGHVIYFERVKDLIELASGDRYSPQYIEGRLKFSPYIGHAMTFGDKAHNTVTAIITIDFENVGRWAEKNGLPYTTYTDLAQKPQVYALIRKDVEEVNRTLPPPARVRRFVLLHKEFDADEGEMTRTRKLRRSLLTERYADILHALYSDRPNVQVRATVKYRDGRQSAIDTVLRIESLEAVAPAGAWSVKR